MYLTLTTESFCLHPWPINAVELRSDKPCAYTEGSTTRERGNEPSLLSAEQSLHCSCHLDKFAGRCGVYLSAVCCMAGSWGSEDEDR